MLNEISQMEKDKYFILSHICAIKKKRKQMHEYNKTEADSYEPSGKGGEMSAENCQQSNIKNEVRHFITY